MSSIPKSIVRAGLILLAAAVVVLLLMQTPQYHKWRAEYKLRQAERNLEETPRF